MNRRRVMTLTVLGLSLRDEILVKSLLNVVGGSTQAQWRFIDEIDADVALCDPTSPLARIAAQKSQLSGRPCCVALLYDQALTHTLPHTIRAPLRVGELVAMLDKLSGSSAIVQSAVAPIAPLIGSGIQISPLPLAEAVRQLMAANDAAKPDSAWRMSIGSVSMDFLLPECRYAVRDELLTVDALADLALNAAVESMARLDSEETAALHALPMTATKPINPLLWRMGLTMAPDLAMPWFEANVGLRLKRWPDFGQFGAHRAHLALAAQLTRTTWRIDDLIDASGFADAEVRPFINACGLCGLMTMEPVAPQVATPPPSRRLGVSGLFRSLRSALRMGS